MKIWIIVALSILLGACGSQSNYTLTSPDGALVLTLTQTSDGTAVYEVSLRGQPVLQPSPLGITLNSAEFTRELTVSAVGEPSLVKEHYTMVQGKQRAIDYQAQEQRFAVSNADGQSLQVVFRVSNDGVALQYSFTGEQTTQVSMVDELTGFAMPEGTKAWLQPVALAQTGYKNTNPSYEEHYQMGIDAGTASPTEAGWVFPALFKAPAAWVLITEAGMDGRFHGSRLRQHSDKGVYRIGQPMQPEVTIGGARLANAPGELHSPWRVITVGDLATVTESTLGTDLADAAVQDMDWVEPGIASWSWALLKDDSVNFATSKEFVDYAAAMGWNYTLIDADWDQKIGWQKLAELVDYAAEKGVGILVWYNSSGAWNETIYTPKSALLTQADREREFSRLAEVGVKGVKIDFFPGDGQSVMAYYLELARDAAKHRLLLNYHGSSLPRGLHRTYPNLMTMESVHGFEMITFMQNSADLAASHMAMLPFTRNVFDPMDFTPTTFDEIPNIERRTSNGFELALPVLFTSGIQHIAETPAGMAKVPEYVKAYMSDIPTLWDETRLLSGMPGEHAVMARRRGTDWFIAGINGTDTEQTLTLDLSFITASKGQLITDGETNRSFTKRQVAGGKTLDITLRPRGGFVLNF
ncbi:glycoside hydrolase family 97 protein [Gilvimarinus agarilyticus]|uniref:glycoside hydrolase family 97 protein n=1 Tax=Gilvimarinus agarilyticus TaxID=679259 RepID=UPI0005A22585|nr:glycoside hydrolase family 97 protein [Gilvimarinus agarilyticus]